MKYQIRTKESEFHTEDETPQPYIAGHVNEFASEAEAIEFLKYHYEEFFEDDVNPDDFFEIVELP